MTAGNVRKLRVEGDFAYIPLTRGYEARIDLADAPMVEAYNWKALVGSHTVYAGRNVWRDGRIITLRLHRIILAAPEGFSVDHIDSDGLNNTRANLRIATYAQNGQNARIRKDNTSGYKGVSRHGSKWQSVIMANGRKRYLGLFPTIQEAAAAYAMASVELHGDFRRTA